MGEARRRPRRTRCGREGGVVNLPDLVLGPTGNRYRLPGGVAWFSQTPPGGLSA